MNHMRCLGRPFHRAGTIAGWGRVAETVPERPGVYAILWPIARAPSFLLKSPAGHWKGKDPTVRGDRLVARWVEGTSILYIGAAANLRQRIQLLVSFGAGHPVMHWGGRALWQLEGIETAHIAWSLTLKNCERCIENELLAAFKSKYLSLPFANLSGPKRHEALHEGCIWGS